LIKNVLQEVDDQRKYTFKMIENIASIEFLSSSADEPPKWHNIADSKSNIVASSNTPLA
jgi:hypothetical protein